MSDYLDGILPNSNTSLTQAELDMRIRAYPVSVPGDLTYRYRLNPSSYDAINTQTGVEYFGRTANLSRVRNAAGYQKTTISVPGPSVPTAEESLQPVRAPLSPEVPTSAIVLAGALALATLFFGAS